MEDTEAFVSMELDSSRNKLLRVEILLSIAMFSTAVASEGCSAAGTGRARIRAHEGSTSLPRRHRRRGTGRERAAALGLGAIEMDVPASQRGGSGGLWRALSGHLPCRQGQHQPVLAILAKVHVARRLGVLDRLGLPREPLPANAAPDRKAGGVRELQRGAQGRSPLPCTRPCLPQDLACLLPWRRRVSSIAACMAESISAAFAWVRGRSRWPRDGWTPHPIPPFQRP